MKPLALILSLLTFAVPAGAVNIPPDATVDHDSVVGKAILGPHTVTCPPALRDCVFLVQEIPGTSTNGWIQGADPQFSFIHFSFPDAINTIGSQEFVIHASATGGGIGMSAQLYENGLFVRQLLLDGDLVLFLAPGQEDVVGLPWTFDELSDTSGADVEIRVSLYGTECPPAPLVCPPARLEAVGWSTAVNIPPDAIQFEHFMTGNLWDIQEIPGSSLDAAMYGTSVASSLRLSFPDPPTLAGFQKFILHVSGGEDYSTFVSAELLEDGFFVRGMLLSGQNQVEVEAGDDVLIYAPWAFSELADTSGADVEIVIQIFGECMVPVCSPNNWEAGYLEAVGWRNGYD